jgi:plasmid stability protein
MSSINIDQNTRNTYNVYMHTIQYTIRGIPQDLDRVIRKKAERSGKSFNATVVEALTRALDLDNSDKKQSIFDRLPGSTTLDQAFFDAIEAQSQIDPEMWK